MKNKRLSARVIAVFAAVLLITALSVPAFAASSYTVSSDDRIEAFTYSVLIPEGKYNLSSYVTDGDVEMEVHTLEPIDIVYGPFVDGDFSSDNGFGVDVPGELTLTSGDTVTTQTVNIGLVICLLDEKAASFIAVGVDGNDALFLDYPVTFTPVYESPSLTDYITAETLPSVLNEVIALLPLALGVIVAYIAIRKGISYLQSFLHNS